MEETPGRLEYEVALYKEAPARINNSSINELPVDQAVPIGTKLQLRARINPKSGEYGVLLNNFFVVFNIALVMYVIIVQRVITGKKILFESKLNIVDRNRCNLPEK